MTESADSYPDPSGSAPAAGSGEQSREAPPLRLFLRGAVAAAGAVARLHEATPFHGGLTAGTLLVDPDAGTASIAAAPAPDVDHWAYRAPEQTGRLHRPVDSRSDLYSLGVILYERLTGTPPFEARDPLEWAHRHLAMAPPPPRTIDSSIPEAVEEIVLRLLAKDPDDRYQTAVGLHHDLERCLEEWELAGAVTPFALGGRDRTDRFSIPQKVYGRESERGALVEAFAGVVEDRGPRLLLLAGKAGVGKSALVRELAPPVAAVGGFLVSGKFDEAQRGVPYAPIVDAFRDLVGLVLAGSDVRLTTWRRRLQAAVGDNGRLITDVLPDAELVIGPQPRVAPLPPAEAHYRFAVVFRRFASAFATPEHPLVLFLDDLQWADPASLRLLADLAGDRTLRSLLVVGAYRDGEVAPDGLLLRTLEEIRLGGTPIETVEVGPLAAEPLTRLLGDALGMEPAECEPLQGLLREKTGGNPLFFTQLLVELGRSELVRFDRDALRWTWHAETIRREAFSGNVVDLMAERLERSPPETQRTLSLAACLGGSFDPETLARVAERAPEETARVIEEAVDDGLLVRSQEGYRFRHDRIQEAAYSRIPVAERASSHLGVGRALLAHISADSLPEHVFELVGQLNRGSSAVEGQSERLELVRLNRLAAQRARAAAAFGAASEYCRVGLDLLGPDGWTSEHELAFELTRERAECELYGGNLEEVERLLGSGLANAHTRLERALCRRIEIDLHTTSGRPLEALESAIELLRMYGLDLSVHPTLDQAEAADRAVRERLGDRPFEAFVDLPLADDVEIEAALDVLAGMLPSAYFADLHLHRLVACHIVDFTLRHGVFAASAMGIAAYGFELSIMGRYAEADRLGRVALALVDRHGFVAYRAKICNLLGAALTLWTRDLRAGIEFSRQGVRSGIENGDVLFASLCWVQVVLIRLAAGDPLEEVEDEVDEALEFVRGARFAALGDGLVLAGQLVRTLRGLTDGPASLNGPGFDERGFEEALPAHPLPLIRTWFYLDRLQAQVFGGDSISAVATVETLEPVLPLLRGQHAQVDAAFFSSLAFAGCPAELRSERLPDLRGCAERLRGWADNCPENFAHRAALAAGEVARAEGRGAEALELFAEAIAAARTHRFVHVEALAHESAARACREQDLDASAAAHVREAIACYRRWGAAGKVAELEERFPSLAGPSGGDRSEGLDALAVVKASQAISGEIVLDRLLEKLLGAVIAQAGARSGALLLSRRRRQLVVAATAEPAGSAVAVTIHTPPAAVSAEVVPETIVNYVSRTQEPLILGDAAGHGAFASDPYVIRRSVKSVLCAPILAQRELRGVLYVENDLIADAFTEERLAVLEVLAAQAAISLENASLYAELRHEIAERERTEEGLRASEAQLRQAQKMEAVGRLAGGIAHDFNNLLTAIGGYSMLALERLGSDDPVREDLEQIQRAGEQAAALTRQLLAFSRKQVLAPQLLEIDAVIAALEAMLRRLIGEDVELVIASAQNVGVIRADPGQLEQIILNLALNARDAMPRGGRLTIETGSADLDSESALDVGTSPGAYVTLAVGDTGLGMDAETQSRIFEPFFTTKATGEGTGLGLSTVYGIVQQSGGHVVVDSELGRGSSFTVYLPRVDAAAEALATAVAATAVPRGSETILLVEDEELVRKLVAGALDRLGYTVLEAVDGPDALRVQGHHQGPIHLMITDVVMPQLSGPELARRLAPLAPDMAVLFVSGYAADAVLGQTILDPAAAYVQKPFTPDTLARKAREVLDRARRRR